MFEVPPHPNPDLAPGENWLSLAMIVKNGGRLFTELLAEAGPWVDEIIIGDTGSTDGSVEAAQAAGAQVLEVPWKDDFSQARNTVLEACRGRWILVLDADEKISKTDWQALRTWATSHDPARRPLAGILETRNYIPGRHGRRGWQALPSPDPHPLEAGAPAPGFVPTTKVRLFPNFPEIRFTGCLHETVEASLDQAGIPGLDLPWPIHHFGTMAESEDKSLLYLKLARIKAEAHAHSATAWSELADAAAACGRHEEALEALDQALTLEPGHVARRLTFAWLLKLIGRHDQADLQLRAVAGTSSASTSELAEAFHLQAQIALDSDDPARLEGLPRALAVAVRLDPENGHVHNTLGVWHLRNGRGEPGRRALERAVALLPGVPDPLLNLAVLYDAAGQPGPASQCLERILADHPEHTGARALRERLDQHEKTAANLED